MVLVEQTQVLTVTVASVEAEEKMHQMQTQQT
jgi:hypothetical protein